MSSNLRWNTDNRTEIGFKKNNVILAGLCVGADAQFVPLSGYVDVHVLCSYTNTIYFVLGFSSTIVRMPFWSAILKLDHVNSI